MSANPPEQAHPPGPMRHSSAARRFGPAAWCAVLSVALHGAWFARLPARVAEPAAAPAPVWIEATYEEAAPEATTATKESSTSTAAGGMASTTQASATADGSAPPWIESATASERGERRSTAARQESEANRPAAERDPAAEPATAQHSGVGAHSAEAEPLAAGLNTPPGVAQLAAAHGRAIEARAHENDAEVAPLAGAAAAPGSTAHGAAEVVARSAGAARPAQPTAAAHGSQARAEADARVTHEPAESSPHAHAATTPPPPSAARVTTPTRQPEPTARPQVSARAAALSLDPAQPALRCRQRHDRVERAECDDSHARAEAAQGALSEDLRAVARKVPHLSPREPPELRAQADGSYRYEGHVFRANVRPDGQVVFSDQATRAQLRASLAFFTVVADVNDIAEKHLLGRELYSAEKQWFLDQTRELRERLAQEYRARERLRTRRSLEIALQGIVDDAGKSTTQKHEAVFALWQDCGEDAEAEQHRRMVEAFVRRSMPLGSALEFGAAELERLNAARAGLRRFRPYTDG